MSDKTYNGWSNYETWAVALWIDNEVNSYRYWREAAREAIEEAEPKYGLTSEERARIALADRLKSLHEEVMPEVEGMWADLLNASFGAVDWYELAGHLMEE